MKCWKVLLVVRPSVGGSSTSRDNALIMPAVTVAWKPSGEPIAMAQSPTCIESELPIFAATRSFLSILITARSVRGSVPITFAGYSVSSPVNRTVILEDFSTTWLLVRM